MKKIKFNLHTNGIGVANLEDLQEHFNIDDILEHYKSGLLQRWLEVQGLHKELEKINNLSKEDKKLISKILDIFEIKYSKEDIKEIELSRSYLTNKQRFLEEFKQSENDFNQSLESYFSEFRSTLYQIIENPNNKAIIKANLKRLANDFWSLTLINFRFLCNVFSDCCPLAILLSLDLLRFRKLFMGFKEFENLNKKWWKYDKKIIKNILLEKNNEGSKKLKELWGKDLVLMEHITWNNFIELLSFAHNTLQEFCKTNETRKLCTSFSGSTNGYWKDLVPKTKKVLVLNISSGSLICAPVNSNKIPKELDSEAVNGQFLILDGLQFKSNDASYSVTYLEI